MILVENFDYFCWKLAENTGTVQISSLVDVLNLFYSSTTGTMTVALSGQFSGYIVLLGLCLLLCTFSHPHREPKKKDPAKQNDNNNSKPITLKARTRTRIQTYTHCACAPTQKHPRAQKASWGSSALTPRPLPPPPTTLFSGGSSGKPRGCQRWHRWHSRRHQHRRCHWGREGVDQPSLPGCRLRSKVGVRVSVATRASGCAEGRGQRACLWLKYKKCANHSVIIDVNLRCRRHHKRRPSHRESQGGGWCHHLQGVCVLHIQDSPTAASAEHPWLSEKRRAKRAASSMQARGTLHAALGWV
jgi:hypothetical protein